MDQVFIDRVEHFKKRRVDADVTGLESLEASLVAWAVLAPDLEGDVDGVFAHNFRDSRLLVAALTECDVVELKLLFMASLNGVFVMPLPCRHVREVLVVA